MIEIKTGCDVIRAALYNRARHGHLGPTARDLGVGLVALEDFAYGRGQLSPETLQALAKDLFPHAEYDVELDLMRPVNRTEPKTLGVLSPQFERQPLTFEPGPPPPGPQPVKPEKPQEKRGRPGWLSSSWW